MKSLGLLELKRRTQLHPLYSQRNISIGIVASELKNYLVREVAISVPRQFEQRSLDLMLRYARADVVRDGTPHPATIPSIR